MTYRLSVNIQNNTKTMIFRGFVQFFNFLPESVVMLCPGSAKTTCVFILIPLLLHYLRLLSGIQFFVHSPSTDIKCCKKQRTLLKDDFSKRQHRGIRPLSTIRLIFLDLSLTFFVKMFALRRCYVLFKAEGLICSCMFNVLSLIYI